MNKLFIKKNNAHSPQTKIICGLCAFVLLFVSVIGGVKFWESRQNENAPAAKGVEKTDPRAIEYNGEWYIPKRNIKTFLVMGIDNNGEVSSSNSYNNNGQADFFAVLIIDSSRKAYAVLLIDRDTMTNIDVLGVTGKKAETITAQIALSHTYGSGLEDSCENSRNAVSELLFGAKINNYAAINMDAISTITDYIGGVPVKIKDDFSNVDKTLVKGTTVVLKGSQALTFVRARGNMEESTNKARMNRQWDFLVSILGILREKETENTRFAVDLYQKVSQYVVTDSDTDTLQKTAEEVAGYEFYGIVDIDGRIDNSGEYIEFYPDKKKLLETTVKLLYQKQ